MTAGLDPMRESFLRKLNSGTCGHAYILEGPDGIGKMETARWFASALLCGGENPPCGNCLSCRKVREGYHPDVHIYGAEEKAVSVDDVRELIRETTMSPVEGERMVFILDNAQDMLAPAQNALLKVFEEPPDGVFLFLLAETRKALLPTVRSRGQILVLRGETDEEIDARLRSRFPGASEEERSAAVRVAGGNYGAAEEFLQKKAVQDRETVRGWMDAVFNGGKYEKMAAVASPKVKYKREQLVSLLDLFLRMTADVLEVKAGGEPLLLNRPEAMTYATKYTKKRLAAICDAVVRCRDRVEANGNMTADMAGLIAEIWTKD